MQLQIPSCRAAEEPSEPELNLPVVVERRGQGRCPPLPLLVGLRLDGASLRKAVRSREKLPPPRETVQHAKMLKSVGMLRGP